MKLWITLIGMTVLFTGCTTPSFQLESDKTIKKQAKLIVEQSEEIKALKEKLAKKHTRKKHYRKKHIKHTAVKKAAKTLQVNPNKEKMIPKKNIKLKKVEDTNYSSDYMYPQKDVPKKKAAVVTTASKSISKAECISLIGSEKFAKYTEILGSEAASLRRCNMLKAMKN